MTQQQQESGQEPPLFLPNMAKAIKDGMDNESSRDKALDNMTSEEQNIALRAAEAASMAADDPAWVIVHALSELAKAPEIAKQNTAKAIADEISKTRVEFEKINAEAKTAAAELTVNTIRAIDKAIDEPLKKLSNEIRKTINEAEKETTRPAQKKWTTLIVATSLLLMMAIAGGYFIGAKSIYYSQNKANTIDAQKWANLVRHWQKATSAQQKAFGEMMKRQ